MVKIIEILIKKVVRFNRIRILGDFPALSLKKTHRLHSESFASGLLVCHLPPWLENIRFCYGFIDQARFLKTSPEESLNI